MHLDPNLPTNIQEERRVATCPKGGNCEVAERQALMMRELHDFKTEFTELKESVNEVVTLLKDTKTILSFFKKLGVLIRYIALTAAAIGTIWAAIIHWPKGH